MDKPIDGGKPARRLSLRDANFVQRGNVVMSGDKHSSLRIKADGDRELNIGFKKLGGLYNAVLLDDNGTEVNSSTSGYNKNITDPLQGLTPEALETYLYGAYTDKFETDKKYKTLIAKGVNLFQRP